MGTHASLRGGSHSERHDVRGWWGARRGGTRVAGEWKGPSLPIAAARAAADAAATVAVVTRCALPSLAPLPCLACAMNLLASSVLTPSQQYVTDPLACVVAEGDVSYVKRRWPLPAAASPTRLRGASAVLGTPINA